MTCLMVFFSDKIQGTVNWMAGGFSGASWKHVTMILPYTIIGLVGVSISSKLLNALQLGDDVAKSLGTRVEATRFFPRYVGGFISCFCCKCGRYAHICWSYSATYDAFSSGF